MYGSTPFQRWQRLHSGRSVSSGREASQPIVRQIASAIAVLWNGWGSGEVNGGSIAFAWAERRLPLRKRGAAARILSDVPAMPCHAMPCRAARVMVEPTERHKFAINVSVAEMSAGTHAKALSDGWYITRHSKI